jgi:hypothetical protein
MTQEGRDMLLRIEWRLAQMYGDALVAKSAAMRDRDRARILEAQIWERGTHAAWFQVRSIEDPGFHSSHRGRFDASTTKN